MFKQNENVIIHSVGSDKEYRGKVVGLAQEVSVDVVIYIIELIDKMPNSVWSHVCIPSSCLRKN